jgi:hypothetical protein
VREVAKLSRSLSSFLEEGLSTQVQWEGAVVAAASEIVSRRGENHLPPWTGAETFYLILADVPLAALMRLPSRFSLHKPDRRLHVTRDPAVLKRLLIAQRRATAMEGIADAYAVNGELVLLLGDLSIRSFPTGRIPGMADASRDEFQNFWLDPDGSFLRWPEIDLDLDASALLQAVDPMYLAEVEIGRIAQEDAGTVLREMREERGLRQKDIRGLGERQVRRLEKGTSRLTTDAARDFADSFGLSVEDFLASLGRRLRERREERMGV